MTNMSRQCNRIAGQKDEGTTGKHLFVDIFSTTYLFPTSICTPLRSREALPGTPQAILSSIVLEKCLLLGHSLILFLTMVFITALTFGIGISADIPQVPVE